METKVATTTAKAHRPPTNRTRQAPDPPFKVVSDRPRQEQIINAMMLNNSGRRQQKPLTTAVLATLVNGGSVEVPYSRDEHARIMGRFKGIEARRTDEFRFKYSFIMDGGQVPQVPIAVRYWCEAVPKPAPVPPPVPSPLEPVVGRDVE